MEKCLQNGRGVEEADLSKLRRAQFGRSRFLHLAGFQKLGCAGGVLLPFGDARLHFQPGSHQLRRALRTQEGEEGGRHLREGDHQTQLECASPVHELLPLQSAASLRSSRK